MKDDKIYFSIRFLNVSVSRSLAVSKFLFSAMMHHFYNGIALKEIYKRDILEHN